MVPDDMPGARDPFNTPFPSIDHLVDNTDSDVHLNESGIGDMDLGQAPAELHVSDQSWKPIPADSAPEAVLLPEGRRYKTFVHEHSCRSNRDFKSRHLSWRFVAILLISIYGTSMSALFCMVAATEPRYGRKIRTDGILTISGASVLSTFLAKTIELSFVTVVIALLGQALARRAHDQEEKTGITLAEIGMRSWILQPGTLITHWETVRYAGITLLGITSLSSAILAMLYVTAANALVQPRLRYVADDRQMRGTFDLLT
jgi:hypothetical protein